MISKMDMLYSSYNYYDNNEDDWGCYRDKKVKVKLSTDGMNNKQLAELSGECRTIVEAYKNK